MLYAKRRGLDPVTCQKETSQESNKSFRPQIGCENSLWKFSPERYRPGHELCLDDAVRFSEACIGDQNGTEQRIGARVRRSRQKEARGAVLAKELGAPTDMV